MKKTTPLGIGMCSDSTTPPNGSKRNVQQNRDDSSARISADRAERPAIFAWTVHAYTASGALAGVRHDDGGHSMAATAWRFC